MSNDANPLAEVKPDALEDLFSIPPRQLTDDNIEQIVINFRKARHLFAQQGPNATGGEKKTRAAKTTKAPKPAKGSVTVDLDDLGL